MTEIPKTYRLNPAVAIERFGERSLALDCVELRLTELNVTASDLVARLDGQSDLQQIAAAMARDYNQPLETILVDLETTIARMVDLGIIERVQEQGPK